MDAQVILLPVFENMTVERYQLTIRKQTSTLSRSYTCQGCMSAWLSLIIYSKDSPVAKPYSLRRGPGESQILRSLVAVTPLTDVTGKKKALVGSEIRLDTLLDPICDPSIAAILRAKPFLAARGRLTVSSSSTSHRIAPIRQFSVGQSDEALCSSHTLL